MKNKPKVDKKWVEEFDNKFVDWNSPNQITEYHYKQRTTDAIKDFIKQLITQTQQETLEWVLKEVVGEDEGYTGNNDFHQAHTRDEIREKQRQTIKQRMEEGK